jgi:hypothetical protein
LCNRVDYSKAIGRPHNKDLARAKEARQRAVKKAAGEPSAWSTNDLVEATFIYARLRPLARLFLDILLDGRTSVGLESEIAPLFAPDADELTVHALYQETGAIAEQLGRANPVRSASTPFGNMYGLEKTAWKLFEEVRRRLAAARGASAPVAGIKR